MNTLSSTQGVQPTEPYYGEEEDFIQGQLDGHTVTVEQAPASQHKPANNLASSSRNKITNCAKKVFENFSHAVRHIVAFYAYSFSTSESIQSVCKLAKSSIYFAKYAFKAQTPGFNNLYNHFDVVDTVLDVGGIFGDAKYWVTKGWHKDSSWKVASKAFGSVSRGIGTGQFLVNMGLLNLAKVSVQLNRLPFFRVLSLLSPLRVIKDTLGIISSSLSLVDTSLALQKKNSDVTSEIEKLRLNKWELKKRAIKFLNLNETQKAAKLKAKFGKEKFEKTSADALEQEYLNDLDKKFLSLREKLVSQYEQRLHSTHATLFDSIADKKLVDCKVRIVERDQLVKDYQASKTKDWLSIAFNVVKIAAIAMGLVGFALTLNTAAFFIALGAAWLATSAVGMARLYYSFRHETYKEEQEAKLTRLTTLGPVAFAA